MLDPLMASAWGGLRIIRSTLHCKQERWHGPPPPSKAKGRVGTRRAWKRRRHMRMKEPDHVLVLGDTMIVTPRQYGGLKRRIDQDFSKK